MAVRTGDGSEGGENTLAVLRTQLNRVETEITTLRDRTVLDLQRDIYGRADINRQSVFTRLDNLEELTDNIKKVQDSYVAEKAKEDKKRDRRTNIINGILVTTTGGILVQLFLILAGLVTI